MHQPNVQAMGAGAVALPRPANRLLARAANIGTLDWGRLDPRRTDWAAVADSFVHDGLVVDLGRGIGTALWWQGVATLGLLSGAALFLGTLAPPLPGVVRPAATADQAAEARLDAVAPLAMGAATGADRTGAYAPTRYARALAEAPERPRIQVEARLGAIDSVDGALRRAGVGRPDIDAATRLIAQAVELRRVKPGTGFALTLGRRESKRVARPLEALAFRAAFDLRLELARDPSGELVMKRVPIAVDETPLRVSGAVGRSLHAAARAAGLPASAIAEYARQIGYVVDFQREVRGNDRFEMIIEHRRAETGETETGKLLYAGLVNDGKRVELMRWGPRGDFFRADGAGAKKGLIRTPIDGARPVSGFGMRMHPILGYSRLHAGVDFAASTGTPVMAAATGRVVFAGRHGGHGNYVMVEHKPGLRTAYAHLSKINVKPGQQLAQGQVLGAVGSTGLSTGPHLHYEVWMNGRPVNPSSAKLPVGQQLVGGDLNAFKSAMARLRGLAIAGAAPTGAGARG